MLNKKLIKMELIGYSESDNILELLIKSTGESLQSVVKFVYDKNILSDNNLYFVKPKLEILLKAKNNFILYKFSVYLSSRPEHGTTCIICGKNNLRDVTNIKFYNGDFLCEYCLEKEIEEEKKEYEEYSRNKNYNDEMYRESRYYEQLGGDW